MNFLLSLMCRTHTSEVLTLTMAEFPDARDFLYDIPAWARKFAASIQNTYVRGDRGFSFDLVSIAKELGEPQPNEYLLTTLREMCRRHHFTVVRSGWRMTVAWPKPTPSSITTTPTLPASRGRPISAIPHGSFPPLATPSAGVPPPAPVRVLEPDLEMAKLRETAGFPLSLDTVLLISKLPISDDPHVHLLDDLPFVVLESMETHGAFYTFASVEDILVALAGGEEVRFDNSVKLGILKECPHICPLHSLRLESRRAIGRVLRIPADGIITYHVEGIRWLFNRLPRNKTVVDLVKSADTPLAQDIPVHGILQWRKSHEPPYLSFRVAPGDNLWLSWTSLCQWVEDTAEKRGEWSVVEALYPFAVRNPIVKKMLEGFAAELHPGEQLWVQEEKAAAAKKRPRDDKDDTAGIHSPKKAKS
jgi:hypothetical protein